eukprot:629412-Alexandrium_andersonii.AAC.1
MCAQAGRRAVPRCRGCRSVAYPGPGPALYVRYLDLPRERPRSGASNIAAEACLQRDLSQLRGALAGLRAQYLATA